MGCHPNSSLDQSTATMLEEWVTDISLSEFLFKRKYFPKKKKEERNTIEKSTVSAMTENRDSFF